jgi:uroporphyrinogen-III synthase
MSLPLLILRPLDGALQTEARAKAMGLRAIVDPLFIIEPLAWSGPKLAGFDAVLLTSANAVHYGGDQLDGCKSLPVLAVGRQTARVAENAGFAIAEAGDTSGQSLLDQLPADLYRKILWLAGEQHSVLDPGKRALHIVPVYRSKAIALGGKATVCLQSETIVLLHSARAARHLVSELDRLQIMKERHHAVVFSTKVAEAAGPGWRSMHVADRPDDDALLSLASRLCQCR